MNKLDLCLKKADNKILAEKRKIRGVTTNNGLGEPGSNRDLLCIVSTNVV